MKSALFHLAFALIFAGVALVGYGSWYAAVTDASGRVAELDRQVKVQTLVESRTAAARATLAQIADDEAIVQNYFVPEAEVVTFIDDLEARGRAANAAVSILSVAKGTVNGHTALTLVLSVTGPFDAVMRTVGSIEYAPRALATTGFALTETDPNIWRADMTVVAGSLTVPAKKP